VGFDVPFDLQPGGRHLRPDGPRGRAEDPRDLVRGQALDVAEDDRLPLARGQGEEGGLDQPPLLVPGDGVLALARALVGAGQGSRVLERDQPHAVSAPRDVAADVDDDAVEPGPELARFVEPPDVAMEAEEGVLGGVLGQVDAAEQAERGAKDHALVPLDEDGEGLRIAGPRAAHPLGGFRGDGTVGQVGWRQAQVSRRSLRASKGDTRHRVRPLTASITSTLLVAARVVHTRRLAYVFLVYNLVLAWIPLGLSVAVHALDSLRSRVARVALGLCLAAWLAF